MSAGVSFLDALTGPYSGLRRGVVDPETGNAVVTSAPTGEVRQRASLLPVGRDDSGRLVPAVPQSIFDAIDAARFPGRAARGEVNIFDPRTGHVSDEAMGAANGIAGLAMTGSMPFSAPKGALRMFGGMGKDDPLAGLEAALSKIAPEVPSAGPRLLDPNAKSWDLYHGSNAGPDFKRFDANAGSNPAERGAVFFAPDAVTASGYAGTGATKGGEAGPRVFRTTVEPGKTAVYDLQHLVEHDPEFNARARALTTQHEGATWGPVFDDAMADFARNRTEHRAFSAQAEAMGYPASRPDGVPFGYGHIGAAVERAKADGLDTAILRGLGEHGGDDQVIALTPNRVRSFYAPDQLLYSGGPGGAAAGTALSTSGGQQPAPSTLRDALVASYMNR
ncbi:hypothetical protein MKK70_21195 [Methylobacterium sp. E-041]|uniref:hypothetical protein n=1 Tax=Methylobacterium sp. E-041 TaxID=2836573 RepID=UPI001FBA5F4B|nr:hypothetical protein [Methylobacterium sp. E-041]MCJ2107846.1 hypothetical protein [Methylobacterium sp. E-041]